MKICILFIYSESDYYNTMLKIQQKYVHKHNNVDSFFIKFNNLQNDDIIINDDIISVKGEELYLNILDKTIKSFELLLSKNYDYFIRTNISTIIDIEKLICYLENMPRTNFYGGSRMNQLQWYDPPNGIIDKKYWGLYYFVGFNIILSADLVKIMVINKDKLIHSIIDDVAISIFLYENAPQSIINLPKYPFVPDIHPNIDNYKKIEKKYIIYRNKTDNNRNDDIIMMNHILKLIYT
jgi:hypothetical protein